MRQNLPMVAVKSASHRKSANLRSFFEITHVEHMYKRRLPFSSIDPEWTKKLGIDCHGFVYTQNDKSYLTPVTQMRINY